MRSDASGSPADGLPPGPPPGRPAAGSACHPAGCGWWGVRLVCAARVAARAVGGGASGLSVTPATAANGGASARLARRAAVAAGGGHSPLPPHCGVASQPVAARRRASTCGYRRCLTAPPLVGA
ncbi:hypothetical protein C6Y14_32910 [Streptomyces dioscori]|uniref:Uncharacterized protein n=1 Tax=Streptomyces dioscori TaxID=2109333 RepID=A0A2P8PZ29_9ACTN|nr:hypothetical protein C6Y14_32910 [Streptomyces dioscori]